MKKIFTFLIVFCFALVGCSEINKTTKTEQIEGYIIEIEENRILVAEDITSDKYEAIKDKSISDLNEEGISLIYFSNDDISNLRVGNKVEIWFDGKMAESYPGQAGAIKIEVKVEGNEVKKNDEYTEARDVVVEYFEQENLKQPYSVNEWENASVQKITADETYKNLDKSYIGKEIFVVTIVDALAAPLVFVDPNTLEVIGIMPGE